jgi:hypothetical protein
MLQEILSGDSLATIASRELGDPKKWREIAAANGIDIFKALPAEVKIPTAEEAEAWAVTQSRNAINDLKGTVTSNKLYQDVDRFTGGVLTKFVNEQLKTVDGAIEGFVKKEVGGRLKSISKSQTYEGITKVLDWLY